MQGWITDVLPDYRNNNIILWVKGTDGICRKMVESYHPCLYIQATGNAVELVADVCACSCGVRTIKQTEKILELGKPPEEVLQVTFDEYRALPALVKEIQYHDVNHEIEIFNVDVDIVLAYLVQRDLFPMALVELNPLRLRDNIHSIYYSIPKLRTTRIRACQKNGDINTVTVDGKSISGNERNVLETLQERVLRKDPDILLIDHGDDILPVMYRKAREYGIDFTLGRERETTPFGRERSYFSYGRVIYSPPKCLLNGRIHIDTGHSFFFNESMFAGIVEMARLSRIPVQRMSRLTPGTAISAMQIAEAIRQNIAIKWRKNTPEKIKNAKTLFLADRGGMIYEPKVGIHTDVYEIDFTSMYPYIMLNHNISPETILCSCCPESSSRVPWLDYNLCEKRTGLIPVVLEPLVKRRLAYKKHLRTKENEAYRQRKDALKWVLVTCFGYTGYRNARFGRIECHEAINAFARKYLVEAAHIAEEHGFEIINGIIDSLWLEGTGNIKNVCKDIEQRTNIPIEIEGHYRWIVFLPNKGNGAGSLNHYYGAMDDGTLKVRGLEIRRRDTPPLIKQCQEEMLTCMAQAQNDTEFIQCIPQAFDILRHYVNMTRNGEADIESLLWKKTVTREMGKYRQLNETAACVRQLQNVGIDVKPGQRIRYVIRDASSNRYHRKVTVAKDLKCTSPYDVEKYVSFLCKASESMFLPFGYTEMDILRRLDGLTSLSRF
jgi:DNA polymerase elongation subunit (family B)